MHGDCIISTVAFRQMDTLVYITLLMCMKVTQFLAAKRPLLVPGLQASSAFAKAFVQCQSCNSCRPSHGSCPWNPWIFPLGLVPAVDLQERKIGNHPINSHHLSCVWALRLIIPCASICNHWYWPSLPPPRISGVGNNPDFLLRSIFCIFGYTLF